MMPCCVLRAGHGNSSARAAATGPPTAAALTAPLSATNTTTMHSARPTHGMAPAQPASLPLSSPYAQTASLHSTSSTAPPALNSGYPPAPLSQNPHATASPCSPGSASAKPRQHPGPARSGLPSPASDMAEARCSSPAKRNMHTHTVAGMHACSGRDATSGDCDGSHQMAWEQPLRRVASFVAPRDVKASSGQGFSAPMSGSIVATHDGGDGSQGAEQSAQSQRGDELSGARREFCRPLCLA